MLTSDSLNAIMQSITLRGKRYEYGPISHEHPEWGCWLQVVYEEPDIYTGAMQTQRGRRWLIDSVSTVSDIVRTAHKAALASAEHQTCEWFRYQGKAVYTPHQDVAALWDLCEPLPETL